MQRMPWSRILPDPAFCRFCARPTGSQGAHALFLTAAWQRLLVAVRRFYEDQPRGP